MNSPDTSNNPAPPSGRELDALEATRLMEAGLLPGPSPGPNQWEPPTPEALSGLIMGYEISTLLGRGGMGAVYRGIQASLDRIVAIKLLPPDLAADPEFEARFRREAKSMARLNHPNIVQIYDYGQTAGGQHYFVMEFVDGCDLRKLVKSGQLDAEGALNAVSQICSALQYAHELGFVHRDIKPANILINQQGILKVGDFGLAKLVDGDDSHAPASDRISLTMSGAAMGTPQYAAPEQLDGHGHIDHRADLYSLGVMFYEMLTREIPRGAARPPSRKVASLDVRIDGIVFKAMDPDPDERYQTAVDLRTDVDYIRSTPHQPPDVEPLPGAEPQPEPEPGTLSLLADGDPSAPPEPPAPCQQRDTSYAEHGHLPADTIFDTTRSLNSTMLVLGILAILTIGGLALFLANRKTGDNISTDTTITNTVTHNSYFTQLISFGITTAKDLEDVVEFRPWGAGFVGISKEGLPWMKVQELAARTGAEILSVEDSAGGSRQQLLAWLATSYSSHVSSGVWVRERGEARLLNGGSILPATGLNSPRRAILQWGAVKPVVEYVPDGSRIGEVPPPGPAVPKIPPPSPATSAEPARPNAPGKPDPAPPTVVPPANPRPLKWTNRDGKTVQAAFVELSGDSVVVLMNGRQFRIPFTNLSPASVEQAKKLGGRSR